VQVSRETFEELVEQALGEIPTAFAPYLRDVVVDVEDQPTPRALASVGLSDPRQLLGLYHGVPLTERHVEAPSPFPDRISIYQRNIERICRTREQLVAQIRKTVLHEVGHHFGLDEDDLERLGYG
jgi:predicted Zn-dependent protease with MMP-like domain